MTEAKGYAWEQIHQGQKERAAYVLTPSIAESFLSTFADRNPLHVDDVVAKKSGFRERVAHGAILNGFLSHFIGMVFPGRDALLLSTNMQYVSPCYVNDRLMIEASVQQRVESQRVLVLQITVQNESQSQVAARALVQVKVRDPQ